MLARKGVLLSDPSVEQMTHLQWCIEAEAIRDKERQENERTNLIINEVFKASTKFFRETLISLLGLNIGAPKDPNSESERMSYVPLNLYVGRPEIMKEMFDREESGASMASALHDPNLDALNEKLADLDIGDLEPLINTGIYSKDPFERWNAPETQDQLRDLGIVDTLPIEDDDSAR